MVTIKEVKSTIAVAIGGAFAFIIALIWRDVIMGLLNWGGLDINKIDQNSSVGDIAIIIVVAIVITLISVLGILYITKWGGEKK